MGTNSIIPRIIHYCWFGKTEKPEIVLKCIKSWQTYSKGWEIIEWNESNYDVHKVDFIDEAYRCKKWAFVSDYARFDILNQFGGIYFDTDVEMLKQIPEDILNKQAFTAVENSGKVSPGLVFAATKEFSILREIMDVYNHTHFLKNEKENLKTVNEYTTEVLIKYGYQLNGLYQEIKGLSIYPAEFFCGYDQDIHELAITTNTITVHHYSGTWKKPSLKKKLIYWLKKIVGIENYRALIMLKRRIVNSKRI